MHVDNYNPDMSQYTSLSKHIEKPKYLQFGFDN